VLASPRRTPPCPSHRCGVGARTHPAEPRVGSFDVVIDAPFFKNSYSCSSRLRCKPLCKQPFPCAEFTCASCSSVRNVTSSRHAPFETFAPWKRLDEDGPESVALETMLRATCEPRRFLDLIESFLLFEDAHREGPAPHGRQLDLRAHH
jgi:hypothetical protein